LFSKKLRGKYTCGDLTEISALVGLGVETFTVGGTTLKVATSKVTKHDKALSNNQHIFIPFAFTFFYFLAPETVDFLRRIQRDMHSNVMSNIFMNVVFTSIDFVIQNSIVA
jgi:hypothetical protein